MDIKPVDHKFTVINEPALHAEEETAVNVTEEQKNFRAESALHEKVADECDRAINELLHIGDKPLLDYTNNPKNWPGLHYAIEQGQIEIAKAFVHFHPEQIHLFTTPMAVEYYFGGNRVIHNTGYSALELAVKSGSVELVELLLQKGANASLERREHFDAGENIETAQYYSYTPLYWAIQQKNRQMVELLCTHGAPRNPVFVWSRPESKFLFFSSYPRIELHKSALRVAFEYDARDIVEYLLGKAISDEPFATLKKYVVNIRNWPGIHQAIDEGNWQAFELLLEHKEGLFYNNGSSASCFELAMKKENLRFAEALIEQGYPKNRAFNSAVEAKNKTWIERLASRDFPNKDALATAIRLHDAQLVRHLYTLGYRDPKAVTIALDTLQLDIASYFMTSELQAKQESSINGKSIPELLIEYSKNPQGWPGLHYAIEQGHFAVAEAFVRYYPEQIHQYTTPFPVEYFVSGSIDDTDTAIHYDTGYSALELAIKSGSVKLVELLLKNGANASLERREHFDPGYRMDTAQYRVYTPLYWAIMYKNKQMVELLLSHGASIDPAFVYNKPVFRALGNPRIDVRKSALRIALELDAREIAACIVGKEISDETYATLKKYEMNARNWPAIHLAIEGGNWQAFNLLFEHKASYLHTQSYPEPIFTIGTRDELARYQPSSSFELALKQNDPRFAETLIEKGYPKNLALDYAVKAKNSYWIARLASKDLPHNGALSTAIRLHDAQLVSNLYALGYRDPNAMALALDEQELKIAANLIASEPPSFNRSAQIQRACYYTIKSDDLTLFKEFFAYNAVIFSSALTQALTEKAVSILTYLLEIHPEMALEQAHYTRCIELQRLDMLKILVAAHPLNEKAHAECIKRAIDSKNEAILNYLFELRD